MILSSCYNEEKLDTPVFDREIGTPTELDIFIDQNFTQPYNMAVRYKFIDNFVGPGRKATPPSLESVRPMLDFIQTFWVDPYLEIENGVGFFTDHVPSEIIFLGGPLFNDNGTVILGQAEAGARITFTNVNAIDLEDNNWRTEQLNTVYHEFAHTVHQLYKLPNAFETIAATGYTSAGSWFILSDDDAVQRGFVSPYSTSSPDEDFAETVAFFLFDPEFDENFISPEVGCATEECITRNEGRELIQLKISAIQNHYESVTGVNLEELRAAIQSRL